MEIHVLGLNSPIKYDFIFNFDLQAIGTLNCVTVYTIPAPYRRRLRSF
jgi:hypothetical protein